MTGEVTRICSVAPADIRRACLLPADFDYRGPPDSGDACLGQQRAIDAIRFGIDMPQDGYNIFVLGPLGSDRHLLVEQLVADRAKDKGAPHDWCYVNNFANSERPRSLRFPHGRGRRFRDGMQQLIEECSWKFDFLVIDTPATLTTNDSIILSSIVEGTILVISPGKTSAAIFDHSLSAMQQANVKILGTVFNKMPPGRFF